MALALILLLLTLASPGLESVHRWIKLGPLSINVSMTLVPLILFAMSEGRFALGLPVALILLLQPDAGQATAFAIAAVIILQKSSNVLIRYGTSTCIVGLAIGSWFRSDPLAPIDHVERILHLAFANGILLFALAMFAIALLMWPFVLRLKNSRTLRLSFITYFATSFFVTEIGNFPVPLIGAGASSVMGWILAVSLID